MIAFLLTVMLLTGTDKEVSKVISAEACSCGEEGMIAVAKTIQNRSEAWDKTYLEVVTQKNQYFGYTASNKEELYSQCGTISDSVLLRLKNLPDITKGALYFRLPNEPVRAWHKTKTVTICGMDFYK